MGQRGVPDLLLNCGALWKRAKMRNYSYVTLSIFPHLFSPICIIFIVCYHAFHSIGILLHFITTIILFVTLHSVCINCNNRNCHVYICLKHCYYIPFHTFMVNGLLTNCKLNKVNNCQTNTHISPQITH